MRVTFLLCFILWSATIYSQVGIGTTTPDLSSILDIESSDKGILIPRMNSTDRTAIATPAIGLLVYDITTESFWYHDTTQWVEIIGGNGTDMTDDEWFNNVSDSRVELIGKSDGSARNTDENAYFADNGNFVLGNTNPSFLEANGNENVGFAFINRQDWQYTDTSPSFVGLYGGLLSAINLNHQGIRDRQVRFGIRSILESDPSNASHYRVIRSLDGAAFHNGSGNVTVLTGIDIASNTSGSGAIERNFGINIGTGHTGTSTGTINNQYGIFINNRSANNINSFTTNSYGIFVDNVQNATDLNYAIYTNAGDIRFGGLQDDTTSTNKVVTIDTDGVLKTQNTSNLSTITALRSVNNNYNVLSTDATLIADTSSTIATITLPDATSVNGKKFTIKRNGTNNVIINTTSGQIIDGSLTQTLSTNFDFVILQSDGTNWFIIGN